MDSLLVKVNLKLKAILGINDRIVSSKDKTSSVGNEILSSNEDLTKQAVNLVKLLTSRQSMISGYIGRDTVGNIIVEQIKGFGRLEDIDKEIEQSLCGINSIYQKAVGARENLKNNLFDQRILNSNINNQIKDILNIINTIGGDNPEDLDVIEHMIQDIVDRDDVLTWIKKTLTEELLKRCYELKPVTVNKNIDGAQYSKETIVYSVRKFIKLYKTCLKYAMENRLSGNVMLEVLRLAKGQESGTYLIRESISKFNKIDFTILKYTGYAIVQGWDWNNTSALSYLKEDIKEEDLYILLNLAPGMDNILNILKEPC